MNKRFTNVILPLILITGFAIPTHAQGDRANPITTAVPFLRLSADARAAAMGDVSVATNPDVYSSFYNGAKTIFNEKNSGIGITYTPWLSELDINNLYQIGAAGFFKLDDKQALNMGFRFFSKGDFNFTDDAGQDIKTFKPIDLAVEFGYSRKLSENFGIGLTGRYIHSKLADNTGGTSMYEDGNAIAADISGFFQQERGWNFGLALTNLGSKINYGGKDSYIPANIALGTSYNKTIDTDNKITFAVELNKLLVPTPPDPTDLQKVEDYEKKGVVGSWFRSFGDAPGGGSEEIKEVQLGFGTEYSYKDLFHLRAGYFSESKLKGNRNYATVGAGVVYKNAGFNLSYLIPTGNNTNNNALKNTFRLSLLFSAN
jgi:hypothetical protein